MVLQGATNCEQQGHIHLVPNHQNNTLTILWQSDFHRKYLEGFQGLMEYTSSRIQSNVTSNGKTSWPLLFTVATRRTTTDVDENDINFAGRLLNFCSCDKVWLRSPPVAIPRRNLHSNILACLSVWNGGLKNPNNSKLWSAYAAWCCLIGHEWGVLHRVGSMAPFSDIHFAN